MEHGFKAHLLEIVRKRQVELSENQSWQGKLETAAECFQQSTRSKRNKQNCSSKYRTAMKSERRRLWNIQFVVEKLRRDSWKNQLTIAHQISTFERVLCIMIELSIC